MPKQPYLRVGTVLRPQGVKGELKIKPATDDVRRFEVLKRVFIRQSDGIYVEKQVFSGREREGFAFLQLAELNSPEQAEALRGCDLYVTRQDALPPGKGRYYIVDLIGCEVVTDTGLTLGVLSDIRQAGGNDVYEVQNRGGKGLMFPAVKDVFVSVDVDAGRIVLAEKRLREVAVFDD